MMAELIYARAWKRLKAKIETRTSWGKEQLKQAMFECLEQAILEEGDQT